MTFDLEKDGIWVPDDDWRLIEGSERFNSTGFLKLCRYGQRSSALWPMIQATENEWISVSILAYPGGMVVSAADTT